MQIFGASVGNTNGVQSSNIQRVQQSQPAENVSSAQQAAPSSIDTVDQLDISSEARMLSQLKVAGEFRADRVAEIRQQIEMNEYETSEKLDVAVSRLLNELA